MSIISNQSEPHVSTPDYLYQDPPMQGVSNSRLYQKIDGSYEVKEKPLGFIVGEQLRCVSESLMNFGSRVWNFQLFPGAAAQDASQEEPVTAVDNCFMEVPQDIYHQIGALDSIFAHQPHQISIVRGLVNPSRGTQFYQAALLEHIDSILTKDFQSALKENYIVSLNLLKGARLLSSNTIFSELLNLHEQSTNLYTTQILFNEKLQRAVLKEAEITFTSVTELSQYLQNCGDKYDVCKLEVERVLQSGIEHTEELTNKIEEWSYDFLGKFGELESDIKRVLDVILSAGSELDEVIKVFGEYELQRNLYEKKKEEAKKEYEEFILLDKKEIDSVTREWVIVEPKKKFLWITIKEDKYGWVTVKKDFGSKQQKQKYERAKEEETTLASRVQELLGLLESKVGEIPSQSETSGFTLKEAARLLVTALKEVQDFRVAVEVRKEQARCQFQIVRNKFATIRPEIHSKEQAKEFLELLYEKLLCFHAFFVQTYKQSELLKDIRESEVSLSRQISADILSDTNEGLNQIESLVKLVESGEYLTNMISNRELLALLENEI